MFYFDLEYPDLLKEINQGVDNFFQLLKDAVFKKKKKFMFLLVRFNILISPPLLLKPSLYKNIHLIASGSSSLNNKSKFKDSLVGRTINFKMFPLSFKEFLQFKEKEIIISQVKTEKYITDLNNLNREFVIYGGYPMVALENNEEKKGDFMVNY